LAKIKTQSKKKERNQEKYKRNGSKREREEGTGGLFV